MTPTPVDRDALLAGIGHICLQWALIEQTLLAIIAAAENMPLERTYTRFGTLDMFPRMNMAIKLAEEARWSPSLRRRLKAVRSDLQSGLANRRNLFVHGAHKGEVAPGQFELTMVRWAKNERSQIVTVIDAANLALQLAKLSKELESIFLAYGTWKFGIKDDAQGSKKVRHTEAVVRPNRTQQIKRTMKLLIAYLRP